MRITSFIKSIYVTVYLQAINFQYYKGKYHFVFILIYEQTLPLTVLIINLLFFFIHFIIIFQLCSFDEATVPGYQTISGILPQCVRVLYAHDNSFAGLVRWQTIPYIQ